jgi:hypothetical protein
VKSEKSLDMEHPGFEKSIYLTAVWFPDHLTPAVPYAYRVNVFLDGMLQVGLSEAFRGEKGYVVKDGVRKDGIVTFAV